MSEFKSWRSYRLFRNTIIRKTRHVFDDATWDFILAVCASSESRRTCLRHRTILWRAQLGHDFSEDIESRVPFKENRMKPLANSAREGRVNPKGIPCLYLSNERDTAMKEVRPWLGSTISVGEFKISKDLSLVDCSAHTQMRPAYRLLLSKEEPEASEKEQRVWNDVNSAFSTPINKSDSTADYAPTQVLAEAFRSHGYDGIIYKSLLGSGVNVALFDMAVANLMSCQLFDVEGVDFKFREASKRSFEIEHEY